MILGELIRQQRKKLHMNQEQLAAGICTQTAISNLEKQNTPPSIDILIKICQKLNLTLDQIFSEFNQNIDLTDPSEKLVLADKIFLSNDLKKLSEVITNIDERNLNQLDKAHYNYLKSFTESDNDGKIFQLNIVLDTLLSRKNNIWTTLSYFELGNIYLQKKQLKRADYYFSNVLRDLSYTNVSNFNEYSYYLLMILKLSQYYSEDDNVMLSDELIDMGLEDQNYFDAELTSRFYYLRTINLLKQIKIDDNKVSHALIMAIAFSEYSNNQELLNKINTLMTKHNITELKVKP